MASKFNWWDPQIKLPWRRKSGTGSVAAAPAVSGFETVTMVGRRRLAVGFFWKPSRSLVTAKKEASKLGPEMKLDVVALRRSSQGEAQFGLGYKGSGFKVGMYSLAGVVAHNIRERSWVGLWEVRDGFVFVHVTKGLIQSNGDKFLKDEPKAVEEFLSCLKSADVEKVFLPERLLKAIKAEAQKSARAEGARDPLWFDKVSTELLGNFTRLVPPDCRVANVSGATPVGTAIGWVAALGGIAFMLAEIAQTLGWIGPMFTPKAVPIVLRTPDYIGHPTPSAMIKGCETAVLERRMDGVGGFRFQSAACREDSVKGVYRRAGVSLLHASIKSFSGVPSIYVDKDNVSVTAQAPFSDAKMEGGQAMVSKEDAERVLWGIQELGGITGGIDKMDDIGGMDEGVSGLIFWHFDSILSPRLYMGYLNRAGTSMVDVVSFDADKNSWHVGGRTFVR